MTDQEKTAIFEYLGRKLPGVVPSIEPLVYFNYILDHLDEIADQAGIDAFLNSEKAQEKQALITSLEAQLADLKK